MTAIDAIRFLTHEAADCRGRGAGDAICVLLPVIAQALAVQAMSEAEARVFARDLREALKNDLRRAA